MSLPIQTDLITMNFAFWGQPFVQVVSKSTVDLSGMDIAKDAQPIGWGALAPATASTRPQICTST